MYERMAHNLKVRYFKIINYIFYCQKKLTDNNRKHALRAFYCFK